MTRETFHCFCPDISAMLPHNFSESHYNMTTSQRPAEEKSTVGLVPMLNILLNTSGRVKSGSGTEKKCATPEAL